MFLARTFRYKPSALLWQLILFKELQNKPEQNPRGAHMSHCNNWWSTASPAWYWWNGVPHLRIEVWRVTQFLVFQEHDICSCQAGSKGDLLFCWEEHNESLLSYLLSLNMCLCTCWQVFTSQRVKPTTCLCLQTEKAPISTKLYEVSIHKVRCTAMKDG